MSAGCPWSVCPHCQRQQTPSGAARCARMWPVHSSMDKAFRCSLIFEGPHSDGRSLPWIAGQVFYDHSGVARGPNSSYFPSVGPVSRVNNKFMAGPKGPFARGQQTKKFCASYHQCGPSSARPRHFLLSKDKPVATEKLKVSKLLEADAPDKQAIES